MWGPARAGLGSALPPLRSGRLGPGLIVTVTGVAANTEPFLGAAKDRNAGCAGVHVTCCLFHSSLRAWKGASDRPQFSSEKTETPSG